MPAWHSHREVSISGVVSVDQITSSVVLGQDAELKVNEPCKTIKEADLGSSFTDHKLCANVAAHVARPGSSGFARNHSHSLPDSGCRAQHISSVGSSFAAEFGWQHMYNAVEKQHSLAKFVHQHCPIVLPVKSHLNNPNSDLANGIE